MQVAALSQELAVRTLQLEMEWVYNTLEDEALDIAQGTRAAGFLLLRQACIADIRLMHSCGVPNAHCRILQCMHCIT